MASLNAACVRLPAISHAKSHQKPTSFCSIQGLDVACAFWACVLCRSCAGSRSGSRSNQAQAGPAQTAQHYRGCSGIAGAHDRKYGGSVSECSLPNEVSPIKWLATDQPYNSVESVELSSRPHPTALAYWQYTSGSTAVPRGVMISHGNVLAHCKALSLAGDVASRSRSLCWLPYFHDYGLLHGIITPFYSGIPAYLMSPLTFLRRPLRWLEAVSRFAITHSGGPNFSYEACLRAVRQQKEWQVDLSTWMVASCGAEPIHTDTVEQFIETFVPHRLSSSGICPGIWTCRSHAIGDDEADRNGTELLASRASRVG